MTRRLLLLSLVLFSCGLTAAQEKVSLTTPVYVDAGATEFRVWSLYLKRAHPDSPAEIRAVYRETNGGAGFIANGKSLTCLYADSNGNTTAETLIIQLNKANLSTTSLEKLIIQRCQKDLKLGAGAISGTPQE